LLDSALGRNDVYDALTTDRPYRKALSSERALAILRDELVRRGASAIAPPSLRNPEKS